MTAAEHRDEAALKAERARRLRAALDGVVLAPEVTADDVAEKDEPARDREFEANRPPHHG